MSIQLSIAEFENSPTVCVPGGMTAGQAAERARALRDWAQVWGAMPGGRPFVRAAVGTEPFVHVPTRVRVVPGADAGVAADALRGGVAVVVRGVVFEEWERVAAAVREQVRSTCTPAGPFEFHAGDDGFDEGLVRLPVRLAVNTASPASLVEPAALRG